MRLFTLLLASLLLLLLVACAGPQQPAVATEAPAAAPTEAPASPAAAELIPVRFGSIAGASQGYIPDLLQKKGIGEKYGFAVEITPLTGTGQQWTGLRAGDFDVASGSFLDLLRQRQGGLEAQAIRGFIKFSNPIVTLPDAPYEKLADLSGARIGTPSTSLLDWMIIRTAGLKGQDFDIETDAEPVNASPPLITELLSKDEIDAAFQFSDFTIAPLANGTLKKITSVPELMDQAGFDSESFYLTYNLAESWRKQHPDAVPRLIAAMDEAVEMMMTDDSIWPDLAAESGMEDPEMLPLFIEAQRNAFNTTFSRDKLAASQALIDGMIEVVGQEPVGVTKVDAAAFDFDSSEAAQAARK
jgi:ABC-type nitrate/sulfonate/bicarbonate transport system substrate-binding protein